jgi:hypothetical protein
MGSVSSTPQEKQAATTIVAQAMPPQNHAVKGWSK